MVKNKKFEVWMWLKLRPRWKFSFLGQFDYNGDKAKGQKNHVIGMKWTFMNKSNGKYRR